MSGNAIPDPLALSLSPAYSARQSAIYNHDGDDNVFCFSRLASISTFPSSSFEMLIIQRERRDDRGIKAI